MRVVAINRSHKRGGQPQVSTTQTDKTGQDKETKRQTDKTDGQRDRETKKQTEGYSRRTDKRRGYAGVEGRRLGVGCGQGAERTIIHIIRATNAVLLFLTSQTNYQKAKNKNKQTKGESPS